MDILQFIQGEGREKESRTGERRSQEREREGVKFTCGTQISTSLILTSMRDEWTPIRNGIGALYVEYSIQSVMQCQLMPDVVQLDWAHMVLH